MCDVCLHPLGPKLLWFFLVNFSLFHLNSESQLSRGLPCILTPVSSTPHFYADSCRNLSSPFFVPSYFNTELCWAVFHSRQEKNMNMLPYFLYFTKRAVTAHSYPVRAKRTQRKTQPLPSHLVFVWTGNKNMFGKQLGFPFDDWGESQVEGKKMFSYRGILLTLSLL